MARVEVEKVPQKKGMTRREYYATVCYYYPQYKLKEAAQMPARDLKLLLNTAYKIEAIKMINLTQIAAAPQSEKGRGVKKLIEHFKKVAGI